METGKKSSMNNYNAQNGIFEISNRLSYSSQRALILADHLRKQVKYVHGDQVYTELLLIGLSEMESISPKPAKSALSSYGIGRERLVAELLTPTDWTVPDNLLFSLEGKGFSTDIISILPFSGNTMEILRNADKIVDRKRSAQIRSRHIFTALLENKSCYATRWLIDETNFDVRPVLKVLREIHEDQDVTPGLFGYSPGIATADAPAKIDTLGFSPYTQALSEMIIKEDTIPPVVFGIYGTWGAGKSTFMLQVKELLDRWDKQFSTGNKDLPRVISISYNAWAYTDASKLWIGLVKEISKRLEAEIKWWKRPFYWLKRAGWKFFGMVLLSLLPFFLGVVLALASSLWQWADNIEIVRLIVAFAGSLGSIQLLGQKKPLSALVQSALNDLDKPESEGVINQIQKELKNTITDYFSTNSTVSSKDINEKVQEQKIKIVVFIDELDRCPLEKIVDILEAIKLFLAEDIFIVLMAIDPRVAAEAIRMHYKDVENPEIAHEYLEKIVQVPIPIPAAKKDTISNYLNGLMSFDQAPKDEPIGEQMIIEFMDQEENTLQRQEQEKTLEQPFKPLNLFDTFNELQVLAEFGEKYLDSNPRRIKRLLNTYRYIKILAHREGRQTGLDDWQRQTIFWLGSTICWSPFMQRAERLLITDPDNFSWEDAKEGFSKEYIPSKQVVENLPTDKKIILDYFLFASNFLAENPA